MATIIFYDTTELDKQQLTAALSSTDHHWEFVDDKIAMDNLNPEAEIISVFTTSTVTKEMIDALPNLTLIVCRSTGFNHIDLATATKRDITVVNVPTYGETTVAEYTFTLLLALTRKLPAVLEAENEPFTSAKLTGMDLCNKTFGSIGAGHIGQKALKIAHGFSMRTIAYDPYPNEAAAAELGFEYVSLEELLKTSDVVSLHTPYLPSTHHILDHDRLALMKPGAILVNTARGALVDTKALLDRLCAGQLAGAALDVVEGEELLKYEEEKAILREFDVSEDVLRHSVEISTLKKMDNVILSPHNAYNTHEAIGRINGTSVQNIIDYYNNYVPHQVLKPVPPETGKLILVRHTESEWNAKGVWSGLTDIGLSEKGTTDSITFGAVLSQLKVPVDVAFYTELVRTRETLDGIRQTIAIDDDHIVCEARFNERNYGAYTGMNKWDVKEEVGEERFQAIRRGWDVEFPNGETLKQVYERVIPAYEERVIPLLRQGKNVMLVAHGNSLRALIKYLESIPDDGVGDLEMLMTEIKIYDIDDATGLMEAVDVIDTGVAQKAKY